MLSATAWEAQGVGRREPGVGRGDGECARGRPWLQMGSGRFQNRLEATRRDLPAPHGADLRCPLRPQGGTPSPCACLAGSDPSLLAGEVPLPRPVAPGEVGVLTQVCGVVVGWRDVGPPPDAVARDWGGRSVGTRY